MINTENKIQALKENFETSKEKKLKEYVEACAKSDPNFFRWLFHKDFHNDFDFDLTEKQIREYQEFLKELIS